MIEEESTDDAVDRGRRRDRESPCPSRAGHERVGQLRVDRSVAPVGEAALVAVTVWNPTPVDRTVAVESRLDGAVSPPRVDGVPAPGYREGDDGSDGRLAAPVDGSDGTGRRAGYRGTVPAGERVAVGFAVEGAAAAVRTADSESGSDSESDRPVVRVSDEGRADGSAADGSPVADARRTLGVPGPPRATVPVPTPATDPAATPSGPRRLAGGGRGRSPGSGSAPAEAASRWEWQTPERLVDPARRGGDASEAVGSDETEPLVDAGPGRSVGDRPPTRRRP